MPSLLWMTTVFWATIRGTPFFVYKPLSRDAGKPLSVALIASPPSKPGKFLISPDAAANSLSVSTLPVNFSTVAVILGGSSGLVGVLKTISKYVASPPSGIRVQPSGTGRSIVGAPGVPGVIVVAWMLLFFI